MVVGLAERFEYALEGRNDVVALAAEIAGYASECQATRIVISSISTILCSASRLTLSAPLMTDLVEGLQRTGATTLLLADDPMTPQEELASAYLKRTTAGTIVLSRETQGRGSGVLRLERLHGVTTEPEGRAFRVVSGTGLVTVDPAATPHVYDELEELRRRIAVEIAGADDETTGLTHMLNGGLRLRDPFALFLRDCVAAALKATERCALLVARFGVRPLDDAAPIAEPPSLDAHDFSSVLAGQEILCWLTATEVAVVALGADGQDARALAVRLRRWLAAELGRSGQTLGDFRVATAAHPADGETIDGLLEAVGSALAHVDETRTATEAVA